MSFDLSKGFDDIIINPQPPKGGAGATLKKDVYNQVFQSPFTRGFRGCSTGMAVCLTSYDLRIPPAVRLFTFFFFLFLRLITYDLLLSCFKLPVP